MVRLGWPLLLVLITLAFHGGAEARAECVPGPQVRSLIDSGQVIPTAAATRAARGAAQGELIGQRLCGSGSGYQYVVTFLRQDGKVTRVSIDARSGAVLAVK